MPVMNMQVPPEGSLDEKFDLGMFQGRWYITAGLNPLFDTFPCQEHYFGVPEPGMLCAYSQCYWLVSCPKMLWLCRPLLL